MFDSLTKRLSQTFKKITGKNRITEDNIKTALNEVRKSLLEADVALPVVTEFIDNVRNNALGQEVIKDLNPSQAFIKVVNDELTRILGAERAELNTKTQPPAIFLMAGLQGSGKTTTAAKIAKLLKENDKKSVMLASCDVYRPAAITQLERLAEQIDAPFFNTDEQNPLLRAKQAVDAAKKQFIDILIIDTAGRLHIDDMMMDEIKSIHHAINPVETLFVVDSMTGQDAANTAKAFNEALPITGIVLTKTDGDARGGAALSLKHITGKPIKFIGTGEKIDALEYFYPDRTASRILGMGDMLSVIETIEKKADKKANEALAKKIEKGKKFNLEDFKTQLGQMGNMGNISGLLAKLPGVSQLPQAAMNQAGDKNMKKTMAILSSMNTKELRYPKIIIGGRKKRIANGSGTSIPEVNRVLKQFEDMSKMMEKMMKPGGMQKMMRTLSNIPGFKGIMPK